MIDICSGCTEPYCDKGCCLTSFCDCSVGLCNPCADKAAERCRECGDQHTADMEALG